MRSTIVPGLIPDMWEKPGEESTSSVKFHRVNGDDDDKAWKVPLSDQCKYIYKTASKQSWISSYNELGDLMSNAIETNGQLVLGPLVLAKPEGTPR